MLIDTNVWSELARPRPDARVVAFLTPLRSRVYLSTIVLAEMEFGIAKAPDPVRRERLTQLKNRVVQQCADRMLAPDHKAARIWGELRARLRRAGTPIADMDLMIASQAIAAGMPLVTRNVSDMARTGAVIINPWEA